MQPRDEGSRSGHARLVSAVIGALFALGSLGFLAAGGVALWASTTQRHGGDIDLGTWSCRSTGYAVTSGTTEMFGAAGGWEVMRSLLGTVRIRVTSSAGAGPVFVGIAPAGAASHYLSGSATTPSVALPIATPAMSGAAVALR